MAFRLWIGGLPNAVTHEDVQWWLWRETTSWPLTTQIVRKIDATKCVAFVGFSDEGTAQRVLTGIQGRSHFGVRLTTKWSNDSKAGHGKGVSGGASSAGPLPSVEPTEPTSGPVAAHVKDEQVPVKAETKDVDILVKPQLQDVGVMVQPEDVKPETKDVDIQVSHTYRMWVCSIHLHPYRLQRLMSFHPLKWQFHPHKVLKTLMGHPLR